MSGRSFMFRVDKTSVEKIGVDETAVDKTGIDEPGIVLENSIHKMVR